ncbi:MAG: hypothetical protein AB1489_43695, partial [Acidobacteriota bacterium]
ISGRRQPELSSAKSWIAGTSSDLSITIGLVEFEDNTKWVIPKDYVQITQNSAKITNAVFTQKDYPNGRSNAMATISKGFVKPTAISSALYDCTCACGKNCDGSCVGPIDPGCGVWEGLQCFANCCAAAPNPTQEECQAQ